MSAPQQEVYVADNAAFNKANEEEGLPLGLNEKSEDQGMFGKIIAQGTKPALAVGALAYAIAAFAMDFDRALPLLYLILIAVVLFGLSKASSQIGTFFFGISNQIGESKIASYAVAAVTLLLIAVAIGISIADEPSRIISLVGLITFILLTWLFSWKPKQVVWRPVIGGLLFQFVFGFLILRTDVGYDSFDFLGKQVTALLKYTDAGSDFVFSFLAVSKPAQGNQVFAFQVLPTVIFFSAFVSVLYYIGVLQVIVRVIGNVLSFMLGTSGSESLNAAGNIFVGQTEAPLLISPFLKDMTESEIHATMTGGFATIAGGVLAIYISFNISAPALLSASVMSAPAALAISKLAYPETEDSKTAAGKDYEIVHDSANDVNVIEALSKGITIATQLAINIAGQLIGFLAILGMLDGFLSYFGAFVDIPELSFRLISSYVFYPVAFLMGVEGDDCFAVARLIGVKIFANEFVAYLDLSALVNSNETISARSEVIATYALCGFSNFGSIGVQLGGLCTMAPNQSKKIAKLVFSAMIAGNTACFMTACVAGLLYDPSRK